MKAGAEEVEEYLLEITKKVIADILHQNGSVLESDTSKLEKDRWFDLYPKSLVNFKQHGLVHFRFGIEGIKLEEILGIGSEGNFRAYEYAPERDGDHKPIFLALDSLFQSIPKPDEFESGSREYYYAKKLSS